MRESKRFARRLAKIPTFRRDRAKFESALAGQSAQWPFGPLYPCLDDGGDSAGTTGGHYFHQDLYVAQKIHEAGPSNHLDVGSRIDGFVAHVAAFRAVDVVDIRPLISPNSRIRFHQVDFMDQAKVERLGKWESVSCLHALEHFGLGRYGDPIDPDGWIRGLESLAKVTEVGGTLYLSVPIGRQRIEFNAHRVFGVGTLLEASAKWFALLRFSYVDDRGDFCDLGTADESFIESNVRNLNYGCGIFTLVRI